MNLGRSLYIALIDARMTQEALAKELGVSRQVVNNWCRSGRVGLNNLEKISKIFDLKVSEFVALGEIEGKKAVGRHTIETMRDDLGA